MRQMWVETACCAMANGGSIGIALYKLVGNRGKEKIYLP